MKLLHLHLTEPIKARLAQRGAVVAVFLGLHKAFDTENQLLKFIFSSPSLAWMSSYLSNRIECVEDVPSNNMMSTMGVPQGSVLDLIVPFIY